MKTLSCTLGLAVLLFAGGCSSLNDHVDEMSNQIHSELTAMEAWARWSWCYDDLVHPHDFAKGFRAGYENILNGGNGCQPTLPPRHYWHSSFRNAEGNCRINAWFDGFSHGVLAAHKDGAGSYGQIPLSPTARANWETARQPAPEYDWSASEAPPAPVPPADVTPAPLPGLPDHVAPGTKKPRAYEAEAQPLLDSPVEATTTGRVNIPSFGT